MRELISAERVNSKDGCALGCLCFVGLIFGTSICLIAGTNAIEQQGQREEEIYEANPNYNGIVGFTRIINSGVEAFLGVTILSAIIFFMGMWFIFKEDKKNKG